MTLDSPWFLLLLLLAVPCWLLWKRSVSLRKERLQKYAESAFTGKLLLGENLVLRLWHFILLFASVIFLVAAVAGPQLAGGKQKVKNTGIDIVLVVDISNSMLARDLQPSRLERAKLGLLQFIPKTGEDRLGIVVFAGQAYSQLPLTSDHSAAEMVVNSLSPDIISMQGTSIGAAIDRATSSFIKDDSKRGKAIILISDGENHEDDAVEESKRAAEQGIIVNCIGIGSTTGAKIPLYDDQGNFTGNKLDENGNEVTTRMDESLLQDVASSGKGIYLRATSADIGFQTIYNKLQGLNKTTKETWRYSVFTPLFQIFLILAIISLIAETFLPEGQRN
ncbi:MAG: VWA domain-containing protein [Bacteroidetes bacterium]|nr:VWA domain-containing protein [Bacteroidota bacterium]